MFRLRKSYCELNSIRKRTHCSSVVNPMTNLLDLTESSDFTKTLAVTNAQCLLQFCTFLLYFAVKVSANCFMRPTLLIELPTSFFFRISNNVSHGLKKNKVVCEKTLHLFNIGSSTLRSLVWEISHLFMNCWGSLANPRKNSRLIFNWLILSTVSCILLSRL